ncbi:MAG TPA: TonB family protein [Candidatus Eremiobacteraceae bacterium]|nr:TonB family protein [Candidatus Eremiobacteraceae bacterium]
MKGTIEIREPEVKEAPQVQRPAVADSALERLMTAPVQIRPMFSDSLLRYEGQKRRQTWATLGSFVLQCLVIIGLILLPLYYTQQLPTAQLLTFLVAPPPPPPPPPAAQQATKIIKQIQSDLLSGGQLRTPTKIPEKVQMIKEEEAPPPMPSTGGVVGGVPGGIPGGQLNGVIGGIVNATSNLAYIPKLQPVVPQRIRISQGVTSGLLIHKVEPPYPPLARSARIQGNVLLKAIIDKEGNIQDLQLVSGHPMLVPAAIQAVKQWRYRPYLLNGQPVEVETTITVIFSLVG